MRAVLDTNIVIRGVIRPLSTVGPVLDRLEAGDYTIIYSQPIIDELLEKLTLPRIARKYALSEQAIDDVLTTIVVRGEFVVPSRRVNVCRDPNDDMFIEAALAGGASVVVTGDEDLLTLKKYETVRFVTPRIFLRLLDEHVAN